MGCPCFPKLDVDVSALPVQGSAVVGADALPFQQYGMQPGFPVKGIEFGQKLVEAFVGLFYLCRSGPVPFQDRGAAWRAARFGR